MNSIEHLRAAERYTSRASHLRSDISWTPVDSDEAAHCIKLAELHIALADAMGRAVLSVDTRRDPDDVPPGTGWPPVHGDIWRDEEGQTWTCESTGNLVCLNDGTVGSPAEAHAELMQLAYRPYVSSASPFDAECPF